MCRSICVNVGTLLSGYQILVICYNFFVYYVSKHRDSRGRGPVPSVWLDVGCVQGSAYVGACVIEVYVYGSCGGVFGGRCVSNVTCV